MRMPSLSWVLPVVTITLCATFAAKAASHVVEASYLGEPAASHERPRVAAAPAPSPRRSKDGKQLVERNMFCSECTPPAPSATDPSQIPITSLPLSLVATAVSRDPGRSLASVVDTQSHHQGAYRVGERLPGGGAIVVIRYQSLDFENGGRVERLLLGDAQPPAIAATPPVAPQAPTTPTVPTDASSLAAELEAGIRKVNDTTFEVERSLVDRALANPVAFIKGGRAAPAMVDGKPVGFRLFAVRSGSALARLGLASGDTLTAINGFDLTSMDATMNAYAKLRDATSLELSVDRKGKPTTLRYAIR